MLKPEDWGRLWFPKCGVSVAPKLGPQNRALKTTSLARVLIRTWWDPVGPSSSLRWDPKIGLGGTRWVPALLYVGPKSGSVGRGGTRWVPALLYVGPYTPFGFYNAN